KTPVLARLLARLAIALRAEHDDEPATAPSEAALALARSADDASALAHALYAWLVTHVRPDNMEERATIATELARVAEQAQELGLAWSGYRWRVSTMFESADRLGADIAFAACERLSVMVGQQPHCDR